MNFYYDIQFNILGTVYATLGVVVTSLYQVVSSFVFVWYSKHHALCREFIQSSSTSTLAAVLFFITDSFCKRKLVSMKHKMSPSFFWKHV
jgi:hypothetical protein